MREWYKKYQKLINWILVGIFFTFISVLLFQILIYDGFVQNVEKVSKISSVFRDIFYMAAICVAGLWTYYIFIKGRTFEPRARLSISLKDLSDANALAIIRFTITNIGKVKLSSLKGQARYFIGKEDQYGIIYAPYFIEEDLLRNYRERYEDTVLEPGDEINIDTPLIINGINNSLLMIKSIFEVSEYRFYKENCMFFIQREKK